MGQQHTFADFLNKLIRQDGRHVRQLSQATAELFGLANQVPHNTISRWRRGGAKKPRSWVDIVKLSAALQLSQEELHQLLQAAGHDLPDILDAEPPLPSLFDPWRAPAPGKLPPFQAPPTVPGFVGREEWVESLKRYLCSQGQSRVCCLLGMAGLGKTSLAAQLAYQLQHHFTDGILWLQLDQTDSMAALQAIAESYGQDFSVYPDLGTRSSKLRELLASKTALLILDHAQNDDQIRPLLPPDGACAVLITSRRLDLAAADNAYRITLLPFNEEKAESMALFRHALGKKVVAAEPEPLQQLAAHVGHLPLAVHIMAQRLKHEPGWTAVQMLTRWQQAERPLDLLVWGDQQVRARLAASYADLALPEQRLLAMLGIFPSTFAVESAAAVMERPLPEVTDGLRRLYAHSLLLAGANGRYTLPPLLRAFSQEQPQQAAWRQRFVAHFTGTVLAEGDVAAEQHNIVVAIALAARLAQDEVVVTAVTALFPHLQRTGQHEEARVLLQQAQRTARRRQDIKGLARILHQSGFTAMKRGEPNEAESFYAEALDLAQQLGDVNQTAEILHKLGALAHRRGRMEEAQQFSQEALALARQLDNRQLIASLLSNLGLAEATSGRLNEALPYYHEALALARQLNDMGLVINILQNMGHVHEQRGDYAQAKTHYADGLAMAETLNDPEMRSRMLGNIGAVACHLGNYAEAAGHFRQGLALAEANGLLVQQYRQQANLGEAAALRGQHRQANAHYREALALVRQLGFAEDLGIILNQAGECFLQQDAYREAADYFQEAQQIARDQGLHRIGPLSLFGLARVAKGRGNMVEARQLGEQSRQQLLAIGHRKAEEVWWWLQELPRTGPPA